MTVAPRSALQWVIRRYVGSLAVLAASDILLTINENITTSSMLLLLLKPLAELVSRP